MAEPPYGIICNRLKAGKVVPFLGAGASLVGRPPDAPWAAGASPFLPSGVDLARYLADEASFPSRDPRDRDDLAKVASYYAAMSGRDPLLQELRRIFGRDYECSSLHRLLAAVPAPLVIVATNYDLLVEQAFRAAGKPYDLVVYPADRTDAANAVLWWPHGADQPQVKVPNEFYIDLEKTTVIYKMHGTISQCRLSPTILSLQKKITSHSSPAWPLTRPFLLFLRAFSKA